MSNSDKYLPILPTNSALFNGVQTPSVDKYADFIEFEDENGTVLLIKYGSIIYNFRGNDYCTYILCNEKTGYEEHGIAKVSGGQKSRLTDVDRVNNVKAFIERECSNYITSFCKNFYDNGIDEDLMCIGYIRKGTFNEEIFVLYKRRINDIFFFANNITDPKTARVVRIPDNDVNDTLGVINNKNFVTINSLQELRAESKKILDKFSNKPTKKKKSNVKLILVISIIIIALVLFFIFRG